MYTVFLKAPPWIIIRFGNTVLYDFIIADDVVVATTEITKITYIYIATDMNAK